MVQGSGVRSAKVELMHHERNYRSPEVSFIGCCLSEEIYAKERKTESQQVKEQKQHGVEKEGERKLGTSNRTRLNETHGFNTFKHKYSKAQ